MKPDRVKVWRARVAILMALPDACRAEVNALLVDARSARNPAPVVRRWLRSHGLQSGASWLTGPIDSIVNWALTSRVDVVAEPDLWRDQLWQVQSYCDLVQEKLDIVANRKSPTPPQNTGADRDEWRRLRRLWAARVVPRQPIEADPTAQTREAFVVLARKHYDARAADLQALGWGTYRESIDLPEHARWLLRRFVHLEGPEAIGGRPEQSDAVRKAVQRLARQAGLGRPRPARRVA
jgi:hypothetical protein